MNEDCFKCKLRYNYKIGMRKLSRRLNRVFHSADECGHQLRINGREWRQRERREYILLWVSP